MFTETKTEHKSRIWALFGSQIRKPRWIWWHCQVKREKSSSCIVHLSGTAEYNPCLSGSTCEYTETGYSCVCRPGMTGTLCDQGEFPPEMQRSCLHKHSSNNFSFFSRHRRMSVKSLCERRVYERSEPLLLWLSSWMDRNNLRYRYVIIVCHELSVLEPFCTFARNL